MNRLKTYREKAGLTVKEFADKLGITTQGVYYMENIPEAHPRLDSARRIAKALGVGVDTIWPPKKEDL